MLAGSRENAGWVKNLNRTPEVSMRISKHSFIGGARVVEQAEEDALARRLVVSKYQPRESDDLSDWGRTALPVAVDLSSETEEVILEVRNEKAKENIMAAEIGRDDYTLKYVSLAEAKNMSGLRLILGAHTIPGPWREACKSIFYVKKIPYTPVVSAGQDGTDRELLEWTAQNSAPVAIWNDDRPRSTWIEQLYLAERLQPTPTLIPTSIEDRSLMFGSINEIAGQNGFAWSKRLTMIHGTVTNPQVDEPTRSFWLNFGTKYGYSAEAAQAAPARMVEVLHFLGARLEQQKATGSKFFIGNQLSALDIYWAAFAALVQPLPPDLCPMATAFRAFYTEKNPVVTTAVSPALLEHRDFIYREYLELPIVF